MIEAFISYSHKDELVLDRLHTHLAVLIRDNKITKWFDRKILPGGQIDNEISEHLQKCNLFLAIVSPDFLASRYCYDIEMGTAIKLHNTGRLRIIPIIAEPCDWVHTPLGQFKVLPNDGKPIADWTNPNTAYLDIVKELRRIIDEEQSTSEPEKQRPTVNTHVRDNQASRYKVKKTFDKIDKQDFQQKSYKVIRDFIKSEIEEIGKLADIRARFTDIDTQSFSCTILNKARQNSEGHLTLHAKPNLLFGDISISHTQNANGNSSNGSFQIGSNDYELFFENGFAMSMMGRKENEQLNAVEVALIVWQQLLDRAGISYR